MSDDLKENTPFAATVYSERSRFAASRLGAGSRKLTLKPSIAPEKETVYRKDNHPFYSALPKPYAK
jgi:hypothetical protein